MTPERKPSTSNINTEQVLHSGNLEGVNREVPHDETIPSIQEEYADLNTGEIEQAVQVPEDSGALQFKDHEVNPFQEKLAQQRAYHEAATAGFAPTETLQATPEKRTLSKRSKIIAAVAGVALAAGAAFGITKAVEGNPGNNSDAKSTSQSSEGTGNPEMDKLYALMRTVNPDLSQNKVYKTMTLEQQTDMAPLALMSVRDFNQQPRGDQFKFATLVQDTYQDWALFLGNYNKAGQNINLPDHMPVASLSSTGQEIVDGMAVKRCTQWYAMTLTSGGAPEKLDTDRSKSIKLESLVSEPGSALFAGDQNDLATRTKFANNYMCAADMTVQKESAVVTTADGRKEKVVQGPGVLDGTMLQQTYVYEEHPDYTGKNRGNWLITDSVAQNAPAAQTKWISDLTQLR